MPQWNCPSPQTGKTTAGSSTGIVLYLHLRFSVPFRIARSARVGNPLVAIRRHEYCFYLSEELNILSNFDLSKYGYGASQSLHYEIEAMRRSFADRDKYLGDVDFVSVPLKRLLSKAYADSLAREIDPFSATPSIDIYLSNIFARFKSVAS